MNERIGTSGPSPMDKKAGVVSAPTITPDSRGIENKLVTAISTTMDRQSFDPRAFAYMLSLQSISIQHTLMTSILALLETYRHKMETNTYNGDAEYELCVLAMRMLDGIRQFKG